MATDRNRKMKEREALVDAASPVIFGSATDHGICERKRLILLNMSDVSRWAAFEKAKSMIISYLYEFINHFSAIAFVLTLAYINFESVARCSSGFGPMCNGLIRVRCEWTLQMFVEWCSIDLRHISDGDAQLVSTIFYRGPFSSGLEMIASQRIGVNILFYIKID